MLALAPLAERAHQRRQPERVADQPRRGVSGAEGRCRSQHKQQQRELDPPGRIDQEYVAVADASGERKRYRRGEYRQQPEQRAHHALPPGARITRFLPRRASAASHDPVRSWRVLKARTASRLSVIDGGSKLTEAEESCLSWARAASEALARASK